MSGMKGGIVLILCVSLLSCLGLQAAGAAQRSYETECEVPPREGDPEITIHGVSITEFDGTVWRRQMTAFGGIEVVADEIVFDCEGGAIEAQGDVFLRALDLSGNATSITAEQARIDFAVRVLDLEGAVTLTTDRGSGSPSVLRSERLVIEIGNEP
jgi:hypothetical protein